jgi:hypothetical protein
VPWETRDQALALRRKKTFGLELCLQARELLEQCPQTRPSHDFNAQLKLTAGFIQGRNGAELHPHTIAGRKFHALQPTAEHDAAYLRALILEGKVAVALWRPREVGNLANDPQQRQISLITSRNALNCVTVSGPPATAAASVDERLQNSFPAFFLDVYVVAQRHWLF